MELVSFTTPPLSQGVICGDCCCISQACLLIAARSRSGGGHLPPFPLTRFHFSPQEFPHSATEMDFWRIGGNLALLHRRGRGMHRIAAVNGDKYTTWQD